MINPLTGKTNEQVLAESTAVAKKAAEMMGKTFTQGVGLSLPSADKISENAPIGLSNIQADIPTSVNNAIKNATTTASGTSAYIQTLQKQIEDINKYVTETKSAALQGMQNTVNSYPSTSISDLTRDLYAQYGITENLGKISEIAPQISTLQDKINAIDLSEAKSIENLRSQPISEITAQGREAAIKRQAAIERSGYAADLSAKTALVEMYRGNISLAQSLISDSVNAATYDIQQQRADLDKLYDYYGDFINSLDKDTQNQLSILRDELKTTEEDQKTEKTNVLNLMLNYPSAGINVNDSLQDATLKAQKASKVLSVSEAKALGVPFGTTEKEAYGLVPGSSSEFTTAQLQRGAATAGIPIADFSKLDADTQNFFINNDTAISNMKKAIDTAKTNGEDPTKIEKEISDSNSPTAVKDAITKYLWSVFPRPTARKKFLGIF